MKTEKSETPAQAGITPSAAIGKSYTAEQIEAIAKVCHQANKAYCESIGDFSQKDWDWAGDHIRESAIAGVQYKIKNLKVSAEEQHNAWMKFKVDAGWVYGEKKDETAKIHPCILPYAELPIDQQKKDKLFLKIVSALS